MAPSILTITPNPTLDVTATIDKLRPQQKLRCGPPRYDPGGGGVNVSRVIKELDGESRAFVCLGGSTGTQVQRLLDEREIDVEIWPMAGETRTSLTVMEASTGLHYRFVLPGPEQPEHQSARLLARLSEVIAGGYRFVVASGSLPPGIPEDFYGRLTQRANAHGAKLILDTHGAALEAAVSARPYIIRLNHYEAQELIGGEAEVAAHDLARQLIERHAAQIAIVTIGEHGAIVATADRQVEIRPPRVTVHSTVGAGDSFVGALTIALARGWPIEDAAGYGVAAAAAAVTTEATELCHADKVAALYAQISSTILAPA
jgi:6-phosphofructokinase 2